jgi:choline dehydrogenase-like flavoprotein
VDEPELGAPRTTKYPMPPIPQSLVDKAFASGIRSTGLRVTPTPQARNSVNRRDRPACCGNGSCIPICPIQAKYDATVHVALAQKAGATLLDRAVADKVTVAPGAVTVGYLRPDRSRGSVTGKTLVLAAHAIETPKLMLLSKLGNDLVGRFLMDHPIQISLALAKDVVEPFRGPLSTSGVEQLRNGPFRARRGAFRIEIGNDGWSFPAGDPPSQAAAFADDGPLGGAGLAKLRARLGRELRLAALVEPLPDPANRVTLATDRDALGIPRPALAYRYDEYTRRGLDAARRTQDRMFAAMGATDVQHEPGPLAAGHVMGTCRMGDDPKASVVDAQLRVHGMQNCFVLGSSTFPSVGTANPTLTIAALTLRAVDPIRRSLTIAG